MTTPTAITEFIAATNAGDTERFLAAFAPDAYLEDWGRGFTGRDEVASWNQTDNIGKQSRFELVTIEGDGPDYLVTLKVSATATTAPGR